MKNKIKHGHARAAGRKTSTYRSWQAMKRRCLNPKATDYPAYGGRGIKVCDRWMQFENFLADMGVKPSRQYTIEREKNDGNYEPDNCHWATRQAQGKNRRRNPLYKLNDGDISTIKQLRSSGLRVREIAERFGLNIRTIFYILKTSKSYR